MPYTLTPAERRARAQAVKQQRESRYALTNYRAAQRKAETEREDQLRKEQIDAENEKNRQNFFTRTFQTIGDLAANVVTGAIKGLEGIYDFGAGIVGGIGGLFNKDFQNSVKEHVAYDWTGETLGKPLQEMTKYSYLKDGGLIENVASGVGQMLPAVGLSLIPGVGQAVSLGYLGTSAAGNSTEEAFQDGADYGKGLLYGAASGAVEMATEKMWSGFGNITGKGYLDSIGTSVASTGARRTLKEAAQEGLEEVASEAVNPALKAIYKGRDALKEYKDPEYWKGVGEAGLVGGLTSVAYNGTVGRIFHNSGRYADVNEAHEEYETLRKKARNLEQNGRIDELAKNGKTNRQNIYESEVENLRIIEDTIKKYDEGKREKFLKRTNLEGMFNKDGSVNSEFAAREGLWELVESPAEGDQKPISPLADQPQKYRSSFSDDRAMKNALDRGKTTAFVGEMTPEQESDFQDFKKAFGKIANKSEGGLKFIVADSMEQNNAYLDSQTGTVVIGVDQFGKGKSGVELANALITSDMWQKSVIHEVKHGMEGTKSDVKLNRQLYSNDAVFEAAQDSFLKRGYFGDKFGQDTQAAREYLYNLIQKGDEVFRQKPDNVSGEEWLSSHMSEEELKDYLTAQSEIPAIAAENVLGNEDFIKKLLRSDANAAQKLLNRISDMKDAFKSLRSKDARAAYTYLQKAEKLYLKAVEEAGGYYSQRRILGLRQKERDEEIDGTETEISEDGAQEVKFSIRNVDGKDVVVIDTDQNIFEGVTRSEYGKVVRAYMRENFRGKTVEGAMFTKISENEYTNSADTKWVRQNERGTFDAKMRASTELDNLVRTGEFIGHEDAVHPHGYNTDGYNRYRVLFTLDGKTFTGEMLVALSGERAVFYDIVRIKEESVSPTGTSSKVLPETGESTLSTISIAQNSEKSTVSEKKGGKNIKFSRKPFSEQVDEVLSGNDSTNTHLNLGTTPKILQDVGLPNLPILMTAQHLKSITGTSGKGKTNYQGLSADIVKELPELIADPVMIFDSLTRDDSIVVVTETTDSDGNPVIAAIKLNGFGRDGGEIISANILTSTYGKENFSSLLKRSVDADKVLFYNKEKSQALSVIPGIQFPNDLANLDSDIIIRKSSAAVKLSEKNFSNNSTKNTKFSRKEGGTEEDRRLSAAQWNKIVANHTKNKVYSRGDAQKVIDSVISSRLDFDEKYGVVRGKDKLIDLLFERFNESPKDGMNNSAHRRAVAIDIAEYIIENSYLENALESDVDLSEAARTLDTIRGYLHKVNLSGIQDEIEYRFDKKNTINLLWGAKEGGTSPDVIAQELKESGIHLDATNEADIFFEMLDVYHEARARVEEQTRKIKLSEYGSEEELEALRSQIEKDILSSFETEGERSAISKERAQNAEQKQKLRERNAKLRERNAELRERNAELIKRFNRDLAQVRDKNRLTNRLLDSVQRIRNWKNGTFVNASTFQPKIFRGSIERLGLIKNRGNLNQSGTRRILAGLSQWYVKENPILSYVDEKNSGYYNEEIAAILQTVSQNQKPLTEAQLNIIFKLQKKSGFSDYKKLLEWYTKENLKGNYNGEVKQLLRDLASDTTFTNEELAALDKVVSYFGHIVENYHKIYRNGKYVDALPIAERYVKTLNENKRITVGWMGKIFDKVFNNERASYFQTFSDPMTVARYIDKYSSGFFTEMLTELRHGAAMTDYMEMNLRAPLEEFLEKHKKYAREVSKRTVIYRETELPVLDAILLYMTLNRDQALLGLAESGFTFDNGKERVRVDGFAMNSEEELSLDDLRGVAAKEQESLFEQFTEEDKSLIKVAESIFEACKNEKYATDMLRMGYSNVISGYYVPMRRANGAINVDTGTYHEEVERVSDLSFNKNTVQGARGELFLEGIDVVLGRHIHGISQYANLATVIDQYNILYNLNLSENANKPMTVGTESANTWAKGNEYFKKLISDVQGISPVRGGGSKFFGFFRGNYAKYQLGLNPKVWVTQLSSLFASSSILDYTSLVKGFFLDAGDVDEYCPLAKVRNHDNSAAMAQGVLENVGKVGDALMKPIGGMDRFVVKRLFGACQVQVQKNYHLEIGTPENKLKAGELLEKVILETQQNSIATERSAAMRSASEMMKTLTMFTADSMKVFGRLIDAIGEVSVLKHKLRAATDSGEIKVLKDQLKQAYKKTGKSAAALASSAIFMALVAEGFRFIYGKDKEDDNIPVMMAVDAIGNLIGGLPLIKDLYAGLIEGYELQNYSYSAMNDLLDAVSGIVNFSEGKPAKKVKDVIFSVGQLFGIPTRNLYNIVYGAIKRISPSAAYEIDNVFYSKNYRTDLKRALEKEDDAMIGTIVGIMLDENVGEVTNSSARKELDRLVRAGFSVLPRSVGKTITYDGEETTLSNRQVEKFKKIYSVANEALVSLVKMSQYQEADDEAKAKAVNFLYDTYYNLAVEDLLGVELENKNTLFAEAIDIEKLAIILATARSITADTDKKGNTISGSRKKKIQAYINSLKLSAAQKYMIMGYLGYSNKNGRAQVKGFIDGLSLSKTEKTRLLGYSGYAA